MADALSPPLAAFHRCLCAALLCLGAMGSSVRAEDRRERKDVAVPPPQPVPQEIKVERGQDIAIPLRIYGQRNQTLTFLIRKPPRTGSVSGLKNTSANAAIVHYRSSRDRNVRSDVFEYAVKSIEGVSAAVPVRIEIIDQAPKLAGPAEVLFPPQLTGATEVQTIELINRGGMTAEGECRVGPPWRLEGATAYRVEPGGRLFAKVVFAPEEGGDFLGELQLSSQPDRSVVLRGIAREALAVKPSKLRLVLEPTTLVRAGVFEVTNHTEAPQLVRISSDARLHCEPEISLAPGQTSPVMVRTMADDAAAVEAEVVLTAGPYHGKTAVSAAPLPAVIRAGERSVDLGLVPGGTVGAGQLSLRNVGGVAGWAIVSATPPFHVAPQRIDVAPGGAAIVPVTVEANAIGTIEQPLHVRTATGTFQLPARAIIVAPGSAPPRSGLSSGALPSAADSAAPDSPLPVNVHDFDFDKPDPTQVVLPVLREPTRCVLEWHAELSPANTFVAERRELSMPSGKLTARWLSMPDFKAERTGQRVRGSFEQLAPGHRYTVRVLAVSTDKRTQIFQTSFDTPRAAKRSGKFAVLTALAVLGAGLGAFVVWKRRRPQPTQAAALKKTQRFV